MKSLPLVSVYMTVKNAQRFIAESIESVLEQTFLNWELIIVDDGSSDETVSIINRYLQQDSRLKLIQTSGIGRGHALNLALEYCQGEYVCNLDADDAFKPNKLKIQTELMDALKIDFLCTKSELIDFSGNKLFSDSSEKKKNGIQVVNNRQIRVLNNKIYKNNVISHITTIIRLDTLRKNGNYDAARRRHFDYELWLRLAESGVTLYIIEEKLAFKRIHKNQSFESTNHLSYVISSCVLQLRYQLRSFRLFRYIPYTLMRLVYGLLPRPFRLFLRRKTKI